MQWVLKMALFCTAFVFAGQCENPRDFMVNLSNEVSEQAKKTSDVDQLMLDISKKVEGISDADYVISRVVGGGVYRDMLSKDKEELKGLMAQQLVKGFVGTLMQIDTGKGLRFYPYREAIEKVAQVKALYRARSGAVVKLKFMLNCESEQWLLQDVSLDGVMVMDGYIAQYKPIAREKGVRGLIQFLKN